MSFEQRITPQGKAASSQAFARARAEALINSPSRQAARRTGRQVTHVGIEPARLVFRSSFRQAQTEQRGTHELLRRAFFVPRRGVTSALNQTNHAAPFISFIADFIASNRVADARALLAAVPPDNRASGDFTAWAAALAEPKVASRLEVGSDSRDDFEWLRRHATDYVGRWIALREGILVAAGHSLRDVLVIVDRTGGRNRVLVHKL